MRVFCSEHGFANQLYFQECLPPSMRYDRCLQFAQRIRRIGNDTLHLPAVAMLPLISRRVSIKLKCRTWD
jgi:hypothetical protein